MTERVSHLIQNLSALIGLLSVTIVFAALHDSAHAGEALAAFVGYAAGSRASHPVIAGAAPIVAAGVVAVMMSGCGGSLPLVAPIVIDGVKWACEGAEKLCDAVDSERHDEACRVVDTVCHVVNP